MPERVIKIIEYIIQEFSQQREHKFPDIDKLSKKLLKKGFTEPEIEKAVEWVLEYIKSDSTNSQQIENEDQFPPLRFLSPAESTYFSAEAYAYLIQLQRLLIITPLQAEQIIEHCYMIGLNRIELEDLKSITFQYLLQRHPGINRSNMFYHPGNDKIN